MFSVELNKQLTLKKHKIMPKSMIIPYFAVENMVQLCKTLNTLLHALFDSHVIAKRWHSTHYCIELRLRLLVT